MGISISCRVDFGTCDDLFNSDLPPPKICDYEAENCEHSFGIDTVDSRARTFATSTAARTPRLHGLGGVKVRPI